LRLRLVVGLPRTVFVLNTTSLQRSVSPPLPRLSVSFSSRPLDRHMEAAGSCPFHDEFFLSSEARCGGGRRPLGDLRFVPFRSHTFSRSSGRKFLHVVVDLAFRGFPTYNYGVEGDDVAFRPSGLFPSSRSYPCRIGRWSFPPDSSRAPALWRVVIFPADVCP